MAVNEIVTARPATAESYAWWTSLKHGGLLIAPSHLAQSFPEDLPPLPRYLDDRLRRDVMRASDGRAESVAKLLDTVLEDVLGLENDTSGVATRGRWFKGADLPSEWSSRAMTGEVIKPRRLWKGPRGAVLPVFVESGGGARLGIGRGRRATSRVVEWLRHTGQKIALLTNGRQWRLIYAGLDHDAFAEWDTDLWFEEGKAGPQVTALRALLGRDALVPRAEGELPPLLAAIAASRKGQAELSAALGERVRQAVELLIREHAQALESLGPNVKPSDIYHAATRVVMRMVVTLFAEARDLLPRDNPIYHGSYGLDGLREALDRSGGGAGSDRLRHQFSAWPRILALFRLVYEGSPHEALPIPRYGGNLFEPGDPGSDDPVRRALSVFEDPENSPNDAVVHQILSLLCRSRVRVRQGRSSMWIEAPVDFSDLSSEYVGMLYEGLLDFELRRAPEGDPIIFLNLGDQPALPLSRLEALDDRAIATLVEKFKERTRQISSNESEGDAGDEEDAEDEDTDEDAVEEDDAEPEDESGEESGEPDLETLETLPDARAADGDARRAATERAWTWALRAVKAGKLVQKPRTSSPLALREYEALCEQAARRLVARVVLPGEWYLVRWGGTRKGSGTFYTRPQLAVPTVHRTLRPLAYEASLGPDGLPDEDAPASQWTPKRPEEILALKVCDPACGSGSFLVAALRFLTDALVESLHHHGRIRSHGDEAVVTLAEGRPESGRLSEELLPCPPHADDFEPRLRARLKRYVVERCIYGVDIDPLAVELARVALWIETMDPALPFSFLDHKVKVGNSLVGCWFDRFRDYPALAWEREGGDKNHTRGVHFEKEAWTKAIRKFRNDRIKGELRTWLESRGDQPALPFPELKVAPEAVHDEATALLERMHSFGVHESEERAAFYRDRILGNPAFQRLKEAFDIWCAIWFWPADRLEEAPTPLNFTDPPRATCDLARQLASEYRFFHWELEFPDVFARPGSGFDAVIGNPPWDTLQPMSKEYFSNLDPLYRTYGKQEALSKQREYFQRSIDEERNWLEYCARFKALANWVKYACSPFGDDIDGGSGLHLGKGTSVLLEQWHSTRSARHGYADPNHPFCYQGGGKPYTYKLFLEQSHALLRDGGRIGLIVPSGVYTDKGAADLRKLFLTQCRWQWLFGFENRDGIFDIHRSFKFCPVIVQKGEQTEAIQTAFMRRNLADWEEGERYAIPYARTQVERFSPHSRAILEICNRRDLEILEKIYGNSVLLGDDGPDGWRIQYAQGDFNMTSDSHLFPPRPWWEARGYRPDEYGRWLKGRWHEGRPPGPRWEMEPGVILSVDGTAWIHEDEIEDVALPLYQGVMIWQFDFAASAYQGGAGLHAKWSSLGWEHKSVESQYLIAESVARETAPQALKPRIGFRDVQNATNERTMIAALIPGFPCGNTVPTLTFSSLKHGLAVLPALVSFPFDRVLRIKMSQNHVNWFYVEELPAPRLLRTGTHPTIMRLVLALTAAGKWFAPLWIETGCADVSWCGQWALALHERLRLRCILDAIVAELYGLEWDDLAWILRECDYPAERLQDKAFTRMLDPKGFWRVDKDKDPELRHTVLTLAAFRDLKDIITSEGDRDKGIDVFCAMNGGEGWMLPETLKLADLGLGHDERAKRAQPVRERLGERFLPWQLEATPEESWKECQLHARNILGEKGYKKLMDELAVAPGDKVKGLAATPEAEACPEVSEEAEWPALAAESHSPYGTGMRGTQLTLFPSGQKNLFGDNADGIPSKKKRQRR